MKGRSKRILSSACSLALALLLVCQTVLAGSVSSMAATRYNPKGWDDNWYDSGFSDAWLSSKMVTNVKLDKSTYIAGEDDGIVVKFNVRSLPSPGDPNYDANLVFEVNIDEGGGILVATKELPISDLKLGINTVDIPVSFTGDEKMYLMVSQDHMDFPASGIVNFDVKTADTVDKEQKDKEEKDKYVDQWLIQEQVSGVTLDSTEFKTGSGQNVDITYNVAKIPNSESLQLDDNLYFAVVTSDYKNKTDDDDDDADDDDDSTGAGKTVVVEKSVPVKQLKIGLNTVSLDAHFPKKGTYYLIVKQTGLGEYHADNNKFKLKLTVKALKDEEGKTINTSASARPEYTVYSSSKAAKMKVFYSIDDITCDYTLLIARCNSESGKSEVQKKNTIAEYSSDQDELVLELGKEQSITLDKTTKDFDLGVYAVALYNNTTDTEVAKELFYVTKEQYLIQRDITKMNDDGKIPFYCDANLRNFSMDKDEKYSFDVCFPLNYQNYMKDIKNCYDYYGKPDDDLKDDDNPYLKDDYNVYMTVKYTPAGSKDTRKLYEKKLTGLYKAHTVSLSSKEIMKKIYDTNKKDTSYAGVVTVQFTNKADSKNVQDVANDAIIMFDESFKFGVYKTANVKKATASPTSAELAYGERVSVKVDENLGGKIIADVYDGSKKIKSVKGTCGLNSDGTASGEAYWDLKNSSGNYVGAGEYTIKVHTVNEYTVFDDDGSTQDKKVESEAKSVKVKVVKPDRKLSISATASGISGGNVVYIEKPVIGAVIKTNLGVSVIASVKNSKGEELKNCSAIIRKGQGSVSLNLSSHKLKAGKYKLTVKAETLDGQKKTVTKSFTMKKLPKSKISNSSISLSNGVGNVSFRISQYADVTVTVKSGKTVKQTVVDHAYTAGTVKASFSYGGFKPGTYSVVIKTHNSGGSKSATKTFVIKKKPVVVKKPTASGLSIRYLTGKDGDRVQGSFYYTGKNSKVVVDIMYNNTEEIVYTYTGKTTKDSGYFTWIWDGFKSNGFRCWPGSYTYRVYVVNSAGKTGYLRQNFEINFG